MPRPLFDSPYIFGLHDPGGENLMAQANRRGWIVFTVEVGSDPSNLSGFDFSPWANQDFGIICRINNGYGSAGTIPYSSQYANFRAPRRQLRRGQPRLQDLGDRQRDEPQPGVARRPERGSSNGHTRGRTCSCPTHAAGTRPRCRPDRTRQQHSLQCAPPAPAAAPGISAAAASAAFEAITPSLYASCFRQCRDAIKLTSGHGDDQVVIGAVAPWNNQVTYPTNPTGDWVTYFVDVLTLLGDGGLDGITLHTYTHGSDPALDYRHEHHERAVPESLLQLPGLPQLYGCGPPCHAQPARVHHGDRPGCTLAGPEQRLGARCLCRN